MDKKPAFAKMDEPYFEKIFELHAGDPAIVKVAAFEPELRGRDIVLPIEFTKDDGTVMRLGFTLDAGHLQDLFSVYEFPEIIE